MPQPNDLSRSLVALDQNSTIIAVVEMSQSSWLVGGMLPGIERQPRKKLEPSPERLLALLHRWRDEAVRAGRTITRIALAFEAGRDGFWLARWLAARGVEAHVIHASSLAWRPLRQSWALPGGGTHADCEPDKVHPGPAGHPQLQTNPAQGCHGQCVTAEPWRATPG